MPLSTQYEVMQSQRSPGASGVIYVEAGEPEPSGGCCPVTCARQPCICVFAIIMAVAAGVAIILVPTGAYQYAGGAFLQANFADSAVRAKYGSPAGKLPTCDPNLPSNAASTGWQTLARHDPVLITAMVQALRLVDLTRLKCHPEVAAVTGSNCVSWATQEYLNIPQTVMPSWRHKSDCSGYDYKISLPCAQIPQEFSVGFTTKSSRWELLATVPDHCALNADSPGSWIVLEKHSNEQETEKIARVSVARLQKLREIGRCGEKPISFIKVIAAYHQALQHSTTAVIMDVDVPGHGTAKACMTASDNPDFNGSLEIGTGLFGEARFNACSNPVLWGACVPLQPLLQNGSEARPVIRGLGLRTEDPHIAASNRQLAMESFMQQRLVSAADDDNHVRPPMMHRDLSQIGTAATLPADYAPHQSSELQHCYTNAEMLDQGSCGLCYASATVAMMSIRKCIELSKAGSFPNPSQFNYAQQEFGECACSVTTSSSKDPAQNCDRRSRCDGGNLAGIWDNWMRMAGRNLRREDCHEYTHKCKESSGIVNPYLGYGSTCSYSAHLDYWDRPCNCIDASVRNLPWQACPHHQDDCTTLPRPDRMYLLAVRPQGLSTEDTLNNIKSHMVEAGPLYSTINIPASFWHFFGHGLPGSYGHAYSDESRISTGGHAVVMVGWGKTTYHDSRGLAGYGHDYWTVRNSWGHSWNGNMGGYGNILAGKDIMNVESNIGAAFFGSHSDYAAPSCKWITYTELPFITPFGTASYTAGVSVLCSEDATLEIIVEEATPTSSRTFYKSKPFRCGSANSGAICSFEGINLLEAGFGLVGAPTTANIIVRSWDENGNEAWIPYGLQLTAGQSSQTDPIFGWLLGKPATWCTGCIDEATYAEPSGTDSFTKLVNLGWQHDQPIGGAPPNLVPEAECEYFGSVAIGSVLHCNTFIYIAVLGLLCCSPCLCCFLCRCCSSYSSSRKQSVVVGQRPDYYARGRPQQRSPQQVAMAPLVPRQGRGRGR